MCVRVRVCVKEPAPKTIVCHVCGRLFRRRADMARHKCTAVRQLPVSQQPGSVQCPACSRWLRSRGGLAVHKCLGSDNCDDRPPFDAPPVAEVPVCTACQRTFKSTAGLKRHRCGPRPKRPTVTDRQHFEHHCRVCSQRQFRRRQDLERHLKHCLPLP